MNSKTALNLSRRAAGLGVTALTVGALVTTFAQPSLGAEQADQAKRVSAQAPGKIKDKTGLAAIEALGGRLDAAAKSLHLSPAKLEKTLRTDPTLRVDSSGNLLYADVQESGTSSITDSVTTPVYATSQTFALHSSNAPLKIYLDFNGHTTTGTKWNTNYAGGNAISTGAFDLDGYPSTFSSREHAAIQAVWLSVREDFAPFNVDVTTQDPGSDGLRYTYNGDPSYGVRVVIGPNNGWYPAAAGGVGYVGSFAYGNDTPVYVFTNTSSGNKFVAEASSHEVGHATGLAHDGTAATAYYPGHNNWAPIMGNSYNKPVTQWSRGEYAGANNTQDDLVIIASYTGWAADDYAGNTSTTGTLPAGTTRYAVINWNGEADGYRFSLGSTRKVNINTWHNTGPVDANVNMRLTLRNSAGAVVAISSPTGDLRTNMTVTLAAGTYYAYVDGVGEGSAFNTGWSSYGSQGYYGIVLNWA